MSGEKQGKSQNGSEIETFTGKFIDPFDLQPEQVCIEDIAHALAAKGRFGGHTKHFYSVAAHSVLVALHPGVRALGPRWMMAALLHDAAEAYLCDVPSPYKSKLYVDPTNTGIGYYSWAEIEHGIEWTIYEAFSAVMPEVFQTDTANDLNHAKTMTAGRSAIKHADLVARRIEAKYLLPSRGAGEHWSWPPEVLADGWEPRHAVTLIDDWLMDIEYETRHYCLGESRPSGWHEFLFTDLFNNLTELIEAEGKTQA